MSRVNDDGRAALQLALAENEEMERRCQDAARQNSALIYDLREKLDFANSAKRRCRNRRAARRCSR